MAENTYRYEIAMQPQPAVTAAEILRLLQAGAIDLYTLVWRETDGEPAYRLLRDIRADLAGEKGEEPRPFVPFFGEQLRRNEKPVEFFQKQTQSELLEQARRFLAEKERREK